MKDYKRRSVCLLLIVFLFVISFSGCITKDNKVEKKNSIDIKFIVRFMNVGEGNCTFIKFPDGKTMLIDCGNGVYDRVLSKTLKECSNRIDYLVLTHPDVEHIGDAKSVIKNNEIGTCFVPHINNLSLFPFYEDIYGVLKENCNDILMSSILKRVEGDDYALMFLYPENEKDMFGSYAVLNNTEEPTEDEIDAICPIIYAECFGIRFLFLSDGLRANEKTVVDNYNIGLYSNILKREIDLNNVDFWLVSNHGGNKGTSEELLQLAKPKNAVISVGLDNLKNHPSSHVLERLNKYCEKIYRTDIKGTITVFSDGQDYYVDTDM